MGINQLKSLLKRYNIKPNFTYGQNFLIDDGILGDIISAAKISSSDCILEIGPGMGNLTREVCERASFVQAIEKDPKFFPILHTIKKDYRKNFRFEITDALEFDYVKAFSLQRIAYSESGVPSRFTLHASRYKVVANIPYYITGKILQMFITAKFKPTSITILTQKEVAQSITARPGQMSVLAISVQLYGEPKIVRFVPSVAFYPSPKVDSAIVSIKLFGRPKHNVTDEKKFFRVVKACFAGKRKQIHNTLTHNLKLSKEKVGEALSSLGIALSARPQELSIEQWIELAKKI